MSPFANRSTSGGALPQGRRLGWARSADPRDVFAKSPEACEGRLALVLGRVLPLFCSSGWLGGWVVGWLGGLVGGRPCLDTPLLQLRN